MISWQTSCKRSIGSASCAPLSYPLPLPGRSTYGTGLRESGQAEPELLRWPGSNPIRCLFVSPAGQSTSVALPTYADTYARPPLRELPLGTVRRQQDVPRPAGSDAGAVALSIDSQRRKAIDGADVQRQRIADVGAARRLHSEGASSVDEVRAQRLAECAGAGSSPAGERSVRYPTGYALACRLPAWSPRKVAGAQLRLVGLP